MDFNQRSLNAKIGEILVSLKLIALFLMALGQGLIQLLNSIELRSGGKVLQTDC